MTAIKPLFILLSSLTLLVLTGCSEPPAPEAIHEQGVLKVISRNGPTTYYQGPEGDTGFEYELAKQFAQFLGVKLEIEATHSLKRMFSALNNGEAHIAAAGLSITEHRRQFLDFSPSYLGVQQQVLYRLHSAKPRNIEELIGHNILVIANSSHSELLTQYAQQYPELRWRTAADMETVDLLDELNSGNISYTIVDSNEYLANRSLYPDIKVAFNLGEKSQLAWAMKKTAANAQLKSDLEGFFRKIEQDGTLKKLQERFFGHVRQISAIGLRTFNKAVKNRLPKYRPLIEKVAAEHGLSWQLLAAISYQESHWNPRAKSPTGVRGMMMLTLPTAREMDVNNRLDMEQSLRGGAAYFNKILSRIPARISDPDRSWLALAAYNIGYGHLEDARKITQGQGANPDSWADVKTRLPLLSKSRVYKFTKHGYARGHEALNYVQNIRMFYNVLRLAELADQRKSPPQNADQFIPNELKNNFNAL